MEDSILNKKKRGRPVKYTGTAIVEPDYAINHPHKLLELMQKGMLDCQIFAAFNIARDTFYRWLREHKDFKDSYDKGLSHCEAFWVEKMRNRFEAGDDKGFKYCIAIMNNKFGWGKDDLKGSVTNNTINVDTLNVLQNKSRENLIDEIRLLGNKHKNLIDVEYIENKDEQSD